MSTDKQKSQTRWWRHPGYAVLGGVLNLFGRLPLSMLYGISDLLYLLAFHVAGYRKKVAKKNISESFPEMTENEVNRTMKKFYRNLADIFVETVKLTHISDEEMKRRMEFRNVELIDRFVDEGRSVCIYFSHCGNWEWAPSVTLWSRTMKSRKDVLACQVYRPLRNEWFDRWYLRLRSRFGSVSYPKRTVLRDLIRDRRDGIKTVTGFMSDQKPSHGDPTYITNFLNHPTAMITGTETLARKMDMAVVYWDMEKISRGHYRITVREMAEHPSEWQPMELTAKYTELLQATIRRDPSIWLWTHKRWKIPVHLPAPSNEPKPGPDPDGKANQSSPNPHQ